MSVKEKILKLKQEVNSIGTSLPLNYIQLEFIEKMELEKDKNISFQKTLNIIEKYAETALKNIQDHNSITELKNAYSEAYILSKLQSLLHIDSFKTSDNKTPDYRATFNEKDIYFELKSLNIFGGNPAHNNMMEQSMLGKIHIEAQIKTGKNYASHTQELEPYLSSKDGYDPRSPRMIIERLIDKITQNVKEGQYKLGNTILIVDLSEQLPIISAPNESIQQNYFSPENNGHASGELWHVAFGEIGSQIIKLRDFDGSSYNDGKLGREGILISHPYIKGILFHIAENFYGLSNCTKDNLDVVNCLKYISLKYVTQ